MIIQHAVTETLKNLFI